MESWPISTTEAAKRLGLPLPTTSVLVIGCRIPTIRISNANCLDEAAFGQLREAARPFLESPRRRKKGRRKKAAVAS